MQSIVLSDYELTTAQAAAYLQISTGHLYNLSCKHKAPHHIRYAGQLRFRQSDLDKWIQKRCE